MAPLGMGKARTKLLSRFFQLLEAVASFRLQFEVTSLAILLIGDRPAAAAVTHFQFPDKSKVVLLYKRSDSKVVWWLVVSTVDPAEIVNKRWRCGGIRYGSQSIGV